jgi:hypothetical protein
VGRRVIKPFLCFTIWFLFAFLSYAQKSTPATNSALTNSDVLKMVEAKLGNEVIVSKIRASTCDFDTSIETILKLKNAGVSDVVIQAMVEAGGATKSQVKDHVPLNPDDSKPQPTPTAQERPRVYLVDRDEWKLSGGFAATETSSVGSIHAGVRRDYTEILKTFAQACPQVTFTDDRTKADYAIVLDHKTWMETSWTGHENEFVIFNRAGDLSYSGATDKMKKAAKDSCKAVLGASKK